MKTVSSFALNLLLIVNISRG
ncbi:leu operon leader peptide [Aliivibrio fischeri ES114]|uniref:Leu operon leader peptide n=1 Tax=Aliivibrio fischeri (strain ATCC 700601 / ES114) TaxID=312309 RepID=B1WMZ6_ALIF1|nr:leu operon leader peptide [Aliivibrio fischeri ES114]